MKCPNCGSPRAKFDVSRKILWGGHRKESSLTRKTDERVNYNAHCLDCGHKWNDQPNTVLAEIEKEQTEEELDMIQAGIEADLDEEQ